MKKNKSRNRQQNIPSLYEQASTYLKTKGTVTVQELYDDLVARNPSATRSDVTNLVWNFVASGVADVEELPPATRSFLEYLRCWERNLWFCISLAASVITLLVIYTIPPDSPIVLIRWILGSVFVLVIPGYVTVEALFPTGRELDTIERGALSVGLSLALVPLIGLLLNYTPWGITLTPIVISLTLFTVSIAFLGIMRRFRMSIVKLQLEQST